MNRQVCSDIIGSQALLQARYYYTRLIGTSPCAVQYSYRIRICRKELDLESFKCSFGDHIYLPLTSTNVRIAGSSTRSATTFHKAWSLNLDLELPGMVAASIYRLADLVCCPLKCVVLAPHVVHVLFDRSPHV